MTSRLISIKNFEIQYLSQKELAWIQQSKPHVLPDQHMVLVSDPLIHPIRRHWELLNRNIFYSLSGQLVGFSRLFFVGISRQPTLGADYNSTRSIRLFYRRRHPN